METAWPAGSSDTIEKSARGSNTATKTPSSTGCCSAPRLRPDHARCSAPSNRARRGDRELVLRRTIELISARLDDLLTALSAPGNDERRLFARALLQRQRASLCDRCGQGRGTRVSARGGDARGKRTGPDRSGTWRYQRRRPHDRVRPAVPAVPHARPVARHVARRPTTRSSRRWRR